MTKRVFFCTAGAILTVALVACESEEPAEEADLIEGIKATAVEAPVVDPPIQAEPIVAEVEAPPVDTGAAVEP